MEFHSIAQGKSVFEVIRRNFPLGRKRGHKGAYITARIRDQSLIRGTQREPLFITARRIERRQRQVNPDDERLAARRRCLSRRGGSCGRGWGSRRLGGCRCGRGGGGLCRRGCRWGCRGRGGGGLCRRGCRWGCRG